MLDWNIDNDTKKHRCPGLQVIRHIGIFYKWLKCPVTIIVFSQSIAEDSLLPLLTVFLIISHIEFESTYEGIL